MPNTHHWLDQDISFVLRVEAWLCHVALVTSYEGIRWLQTAVIGAMFVAASYALFWARQKIRSTPAEKSEDRPLRAAAIACVALFIVVNLSDWPGTVLAQFWAGHAILAATASTLPLLGVGYFAFEAHDQVAQTHLDSKVAATGRGGVVNHLIDIDVALSLLTWERASIKHRWPEYGTDVRALTWLRHDRHLLGRDAQGRVLDTDPRHGAATDDFMGQGWQRDLVMDCVRRVMVGIKEWGPILCRSGDGQKDLIALGQVRLSLLAMVDPTAALDGSVVREVQERCRTLAYEFERRSGAAQYLRPQLLVEKEITHAHSDDHRVPAGR